MGAASALWVWGASQSGVARRPEYYWLGRAYAPSALPLREDLTPRVLLVLLLLEVRWAAGANASLDLRTTQGREAA